MKRNTMSSENYLPMLNISVFRPSSRKRCECFKNLFNVISVTTFILKKPKKKPCHISLCNVSRRLLSSFVQFTYLLI